jgi:hypothetical protein
MIFITHRFASNVFLVYVMGVLSFSIDNSSLPSTRSSRRQRLRDDGVTRGGVRDLLLLIMALLNYNDGSLEHLLIA